MKTIVALALVALLAGCSGRTQSVPNHEAAHSIGRAPQSGGPGTTSLTYYDTHADYGPCSSGVLTLLVGAYMGYPAPATLSFPAGQGPPIEVSTCNFTTPQYVRVTLGTPSYGTPFIRQTDYAATVDAPAAAQVTATWTALGPTLPGTPGLSATVTYTIGASQTSNVLWKTQGGQYSLPAASPPPIGDGQCGTPSISGNNVSFTVLRNTNYTYPYSNPPRPGASSCYRNQMNPVDPNTGTNFLLNMGTQYTFNFQTVVTLNGNYVDYIPSNGGIITFDLPAIVWQTHSYGGDGSPCAILSIDNSWKANYNNSALYPNPPSGGLPTWNFQTCDETEYSSTAYNSPDTLHDGQVDTWQIDITAAYRDHGNGSVVVQRNGAVVYNNQSGHICDNSTSQCFWNFGPYPFYWESSDEPSGFNNLGITVQYNDMTLTTPNGGGGLSRQRAVSGSSRKP